MASTKKPVNKNDKSNKVDAIAFDEGDFLDFSEFDFEQTADSRKPVTKIRQGAVSGAKGALRDRNFIEQAIKRSLPDGYGQAFNVAETASESGRDLYNKATNDLKGPLNEIQRAGARLLPNIKGVVPKKVYESLEKKLAQKEDVFSSRSDAQRKKESDDSEVNGVIAEVFLQSMKADDQNQRQRRANEMVRDKVLDIQHEDTLSQLVTTREGIDRLVSFNDNQNSRYQRKHLEIAYRQLIVQRDLLDVTNRHAGLSTKLLDAIKHNTALPETQKIKLGEAQHQMMRDRMIAGVQNAALDYTREFGSRFKENIDRVVGGAIRNSLGQFTSGMEMASAAGDNDKYEMFGDVAGGSIAQWLGYELADKLGKITGKNESLKRTGSFLKYHTTAIPEAFNDLANRDDGDWSTWGRTKRFARSLIPSHIQETKLGDAPIMDGDRGIGFTNAANRALIEIIPGYLSRMLHMQRVQASGNPNIERIIFNADQGAFTTMGQAVKDASWRMFSPNAQVGATRALDEVINSIDSTKSLNPEHRSALAGQFMRDSMAAKRFSPEFYADANNLPDSMPAEARQAIAAMFKREFAISDDGKFDSRGAHISKAADVRQSFSALKNAIGDPKNMVQGYRDSGQREIMDALGLINRQGLSDHINYDTAWDRVRGSNTNTDVANDKVDLRDLSSMMGPGVVNNYSVDMRSYDQRSFTTNVYSNAFNKSFTAHSKAYTDNSNNYTDNTRTDIDVNNISQVYRSTVNNTSVSVTEMAAAYSAATGASMAESMSVAASDPEEVGAAVGEAVAAEVAASKGYTYRPRYTNARTAKGVRYKDRMAAARSEGPAGAQWSGGSNASYSATYGPQGGTESMGSNAVVDKLNELFGEGGSFTAITMANNANMLLEHEVALTQEIRDILLSMPIGDGGGDPSSPGSSWRDRFLKAGATARGAFGTAGRFAKDAAGQAWDMARGGFRRARNAFGRFSMGGMVGKIFDRFKTGVTAAGRAGLNWLTDIRDSSGRLVLEARKLRAGEYFDQATGKVIHSLKDIKGAVIDKLGNVVLSKEDYDSGIYDLNGKRIILTGVQFAKDSFGAIVDMLKSPGRAIGRAYDWVNNKVLNRNLVKDIYVTGDLDKPRLYAFKIRAGKYFVADGINGIKKVKSWKDCTSDVMDENGNIVLTEDDIKKGLVDYQGIPFGTGLVGRLAYKAANAVAGAMGAARGLLTLPKRAWNKVKSLFGGGPAGAMLIKDTMINLTTQSLDVQAQSLDVLKRILALLDERMPGKKVFGDADGDGLRDGSWQSNEKKRDEDDAKKDAEEERKSGGWLGKLLGGAKGLMGKLFGGKDEGEEDEGGDGGGGNTIIAGGGGGDGKDGKDKKGKDKGKPKGKPKGRLGRLWAATGGRLGGLFKGKGGKAAGAAGAAGAAKKAGFLGKAKNFVGSPTKMAASLAAMYGGSKLLDYTLGEEGDAREAASTAADVGGTAMTASWLSGMVGGPTISSLLGIGGTAATAGTATAATGAAAATGVGGAATTAGTVLGGGALATIGVPLLIGAAVVGAVGYVGYKVYKKYKYGTYVPLRAFRMAQYGVLYTETSMVEKMVDLEQMLEPHVQNMGNGLDISAAKLKPEELYKMFDLEDGWFSSNQAARLQFDKWFNERFKPVFLTWMAAKKYISPSLPLNDVDSDLEQDKKLELIRASTTVSPSVYSIMASPFADEKLEMGARQVDEQYKLALDAIDKEKTTSGKAIAQLRRISGASTAGIGGVTGMGGLLDSAGEGMRQKMDLNSLEKDKARITALAGGNADPVGLTAATVYQRNAGAHFTAIATMMQFQGGVPTNISPLMAIRFKTYGLMELDPLKVRALMILENTVTGNIGFNSSGLATFKGTHQDVFEVVGSIFGILPDMAKEQNNWRIWFWVRFLPTFLNMLTAMRSINPSTAVKDIDTQFKPEQQLILAEAISSSTFKGKEGKSISVWKVPEGPFPDTPVNMNPMSVVDNVSVIKSRVSAQNLTDPTKSNAPGVSASAGGMTASAGPNGVSAGPKPTSWSQGTMADYATKSGMGGYGDGGNTNYGGDGSYIGSGGGVSTPYAGPSMGGNGSPVGTAVTHPGGGTGGDITQLPGLADGAQGATALTPLIVAAAQMAGVDPGLMLTMCSIESGFRPKVGAGTSSARGLYQFINSTWKTMLKKYGSKYGISPNADQGDAAANALMGAEFLKENAAYLKSKIGRDPTDTELYMAHFMGAGGATKAIMSDPNVSGPGAMPAAAKANQSIYYEKGGGARTMGGVMAELERRVRTHRYSSRTYTKVGAQGDPGVGYAAQINKASADAASGQPVANTSTPMPPATGGSADSRAVANARDTIAPSAPVAGGPAGARDVVAPTSQAGTQVAGQSGSAETGPAPAPVDPYMARTQAAQSQAARQEVISTDAAKRTAMANDGMSSIMTQLLQVNISMDQKLGIIAGLTEQSNAVQAEVAVAVAENTASNVKGAAANPTPATPPRKTMASRTPQRTTSNLPVNLDRKSSMLVS